MQSESKTLPNASWYPLYRVRNVKFRSPRINYQTTHKCYVRYQLENSRLALFFINVLSCKSANMLTNYEIFSRKCLLKLQKALSTFLTNYSKLKPSVAALSGEISSRSRGFPHALESRKSHLESLRTSHKTWNLALESGIFWLIKVREFPNNSGYSNSVQLEVCSSRCSYKLVGLL